VFEAQDTEIAAAIELTNIMPTTRAGAVALLKYAVAFEGRGEMWPDGLEDDEGNSIHLGGIDPSKHHEGAGSRYLISKRQVRGARRVRKAWHPLFISCTL
jgi:hypothetical protein